MTKIESLLRPFVGYLELGMYADANEELESIPTELKTHPMVLLARLDLLVEMKKWEDGVVLGKSLSGQWPKEHEFWFRTAYCLHELKRTQEAKDTLLVAPTTIHETATFHYNLACYEAQLGNVEVAKGLLQTAFDKNAAFKQDALDDPDLKPVWDSFGGV